MSDLSSLSHDYATSASFAEEINRSLLKIKKAQANTEGSRSLTKKEIEEAREDLVRLIKAILQLISESANNSTIAQSKSSLPPEEFLEGLRTRNKNQMPYFLEDLKKTINDLDTNRIKSETIRILDQISDLADTTASISFRRLWRR
jgi:hypothetical protein